jgi:hypothetical protein
VKIAEAPHPSLSAQEVHTSLHRRSKHSMLTAKSAKLTIWTVGKTQ